MSKDDNPARKKFEPMLSPFVDGELTPEERTQVEAHLAANKESAMQVADFRAASGLMRLTFEQQSDQEDWKDFSNQVLGKLTPDKPPFFERLKTSLTEMFTYQRRQLAYGMAGALVLALVATAAMQVGAHKAGYGNERMQVQAVRVEQGAKVAPVVMETEGGDAIIWMVDSPPDADKKDEKKDEQKAPGEENEELGTDAEPKKKAGDL